MMDVLAPRPTQSRKLGETGDSEISLIRIVKYAFLWILIICTGVNGLLTQNGEITADSIWYNATDIGYSDCLSGLVDNYLWTQGYNKTSHCCAHNAPSGSLSWLNIKMPSTVVVQTILFLNREQTCCQNRMIGSDFYVGFNSIPNQNTRCNQNPQKSGAFTCGGLVGIYLGLSMNKHDYLNICQIRAYSYVANSYTNYVYNSSLVASCPTVSNLTFKNERVYDTNCKMNLEAAPITFYEIRFDVQRYIHAITLIGSFNATVNNFQASKNFKLAVGDYDGGQAVNMQVIYTFDNNKQDERGKEISVKQNARLVSIYRDDGAALAFRWIAVFSTATNCTGQFDWSASKQDWPTRIPVGITTKVFTGGLFATISDCAVFQQAKSLPSFVTYDYLTKQLNVTVAPNTTAGNYTVEVEAFLNDLVTAPKQDNKQLVFEVFKATDLVLATNLSFTIELQGIAITQDMLSYVAWTPSDAETNISFTLLGQPQFITLSGNIITIASSAIEGAYNFSVECTESISGLTKTSAVTLILYSCQPSQLSFNPTSTQVSILGPSQSINWTYTPLNAACGTYTLSFDLQFASLVTNSGQQLTIFAPKGSATQTSSVAFTLKRDQNPAQQTQASLSISVTPQLITSLAFANVSQSIELKGDAITQDLLTYVSWIPADAQPNLTFTQTGQQQFISLSGTLLTIASNTIEGSYNFSLGCTDSISGLTSTSAVTLILYSCQPSQLSFNPTSSQVSILGPSQSINWTYTPLNAACGSYTLSFDSQFASLVTNSGQQLTIFAPKGSATQTSSVAFTLKRDQNPAQQTQASLSISVTPQLITSLAFANVSQSIELKGDAITQDLLTYVSWIPADAQPNLTFALTGQQQFISLSGALLTIASNTIEGSYNFSVGCTDSISGLTKTSSVFIILYSCQPSRLSFNPSSTQVSILGPSQLINLTYTTLNAACGSQTLSFDSQFTWLVTNSGQQLAIYAPKGSATKNYSVTFTLKLNKNPAQQTQASISIMVTLCVVTSLTFTNASTTSLVEVGIDAQPRSIQFQTIQNPLCDNQVAYTQSRSDLAFVTTITASISEFVLNVNNAKAIHHGEYRILITASVDSVETSMNFVLTIKDPCSATNFVKSPSPLRDMSVVLASTRTSSQSVKIFTIVEQQHSSIICPIKAVLSPSQPFISLSSDFQTIQVDESLLTSMIPASVQTYSFSLDVTSANFPNYVASSIYTFKVIVSCVVQEVRFTDKRISDLSYEIDPKSTTPKLIPFPTYSLFPCLTSVKHQRKLAVDADTEKLLPSFVSYSDQDGSISINISNPASTGVYKFKVVTSEPISGLQNAEVRFTLTLTCTVTQLFNSEKNVNNVIYQIPSDLNSKTVTLPLPVYKTNPDYCLLTPYSLVLIDDASQSQSLPAFIKLNAANILILNKDPTVVGTYSFRFIAKDSRYPQQQDRSVAFSITFGCNITNLAPKLTESTVSQLVYVLRSSPFSFDMPKYSWQPALCQKKLNFKLENVSGASYPKFLRFDIDNLKVTLNGDSFDESGKDFRFRLVATTTDESAKNTDYSFLVKTLFKNTAPTLKGVLSPQTLTAKVSASWRLPEIGDPEGDAISSVSASIDKKAEWLTFDSQKREFSFDGMKANEQNSGQFVVPITITDQYGASNTIKQTLNVIYVAQNKTDEKPIDSGNAQNATSTALTNSTSTNQNQTTQNETIPASQVISTKSSQPAAAQVAATSSWDGWKVLLQTQQQTQKQTQSIVLSVLPPQFLKVKSVSSSGLVLIQFGNPVKVPQEFTKKRQLSSIHDSIFLLVQPNEASAAKVNFSWEVTEFTESQMKIQINFEDANQISVNANPDIMIMQVLDPSVFADAYGSVPTTTSLMACELPPQIKPGSVEEQLVNAVQSAGVGAKSFVIGNFLLSFCLSASLNQLWSLVEAQQIVVLIPMFNIRVPPTSAMLLKKFLEIASFDILPVQLLWQKIFYMPPSQTLEMRYAQLGIEDSCLISNIGSISLSLVASLLIVAVATVIRQLKKKTANQRIRSMWKFIQNTAFWGTPTTIFLESFIMVVLASLLTIKYPNWSSRGQEIDTITAHVLLVVFLCLMVLLPVLMAVNHKTILEPWNKHSKQFAPLYAELRMESQAATFRFAFLLRRLMLAIAIVCFEVLAFQLIMGYAQSTMMIIVIGFQRPFQEKQTWIKELTNEQIILATIYFAMCFSQLIPDLKVQSQIGYIFIGMLGLHVAINLLIMFAHTLITTIHSCRRNYAIRKHKKIQIERLSSIDRLAHRQRIREFLEKRRAQFEEKLDEELGQIENALKMSLFSHMSKLLAHRMALPVICEKQNSGESSDSEIQEEQQNQDEIAHFKVIEEIVFSDRKMEKQQDTFVDSWDQEDTLDDAIEQTAIENVPNELKLSANHNRNQSTDLLIEDEEPSCLDFQQSTFDIDQAPPFQNDRLQGLFYQEQPDKSQEDLHEESKQEVILLDVQDMIQARPPKRSTKQGRKTKKKSWGLQTQAMIQIYGKRQAKK